MPVYRESGATILYDVVKVQTCSGQPLEVTTSDINPVQITDAYASIDWEEISR